MGKQHDGVYYYQGALEKKIVNATKISNLRHKRLGHPGSEAMTTLSNFLSFSNSSRQKLEICDVCFRAKQARTQFRAMRMKQKIYLN